MHGGRLRHDSGDGRDGRHGTTITATSPAGTGTVDVTVVTPGGTSATLPADQFTYGPAVTGLSPTGGSTAGGTFVTITGTGFTGATSVHFGTTPATGLTVVSDMAITVDSPGGHRDRGRDRDNPLRDVAHLARGSVHLRADGNGHEPAAGR